MSILHLESIRLLQAQHPESFPFSIPTIRNIGSLQITKPVAIFVGENGTGKSTLLEGLAAAIGLEVLGDLPIDKDPTLGYARMLGNELKLGWKGKSHQGFFMRAEDYFSYIKRVEEERAYYQEELQKINEEFKDRSRFAQNQARMTLLGSLSSIHRTHGENADALSHGESFIQVFQQKIGFGGLYLLDEPEAALSPTRQLALIALMKQNVDRFSQFIIATHSPILMAYPDAQIFSFDGEEITEIEYDDVEHVALYRSFLKDPESFIHRL